MLTHGIPKLIRFFDGNMQFRDPIGLGQSPSLFLTVFAEVVCASMILIGLGTRLASLPLIITTFVAAFIVNGAQPFGEKELALMYLLIYGALFMLGSGKYSVDNLIQRKQ